MALLGLLLLMLFSAEIQASSVHHIVNGELATQCEFPHIAFLYIQKGPDSFTCVGSLIDDTHIVTAAHCVDGDINIVLAFFGSPNVKSMLLVSNYTQHPGFSQSKDSVYNDVAVLKLAYPVWMENCRKPIRLVEATEKIYGDECVIAGWGKTDFKSGPFHLLRRATVPIMPLRLCTRNVPGIATQHVCVRSGTRFPCKGDSVGPLMCKSAVDGETVLVGLVSYRWTCRDGLRIFTSVRFFHDWILAHAKH